MDERLLRNGRSERHSYVRIVPVDGETFAQTARRLEPWLQSFTLPAGERIALGSYEQREPNSGRAVQVGLRTYVVRGPAVVTGWGVARADASTDENGMAVVQIELTSSGAHHFQQATRNNIGGRLAILIDGTVESAPVVKQEIPTSHVTITMGGDDPKAALDQATRLAIALDSSAKGRRP